jgi:hypothetical protein
LNLADNTLLHDFFCDELNKKMGEKWKHTHEKIF